MGRKDVKLWCKKKNYMGANYMENSGAGQFPELSWTSGRKPDLITQQGPIFGREKGRKLSVVKDNSWRANQKWDVSRYWQLREDASGLEGNFVGALQHPVQPILCIHIHLLPVVSSTHREIASLGFGGCLQKAG